MKFVDEYRDAQAAQILAQKIREILTQSWTIMEICGGQTHTILKYGLEELLPEQLTLVHGPGCPVCVTPLETIDRAVEIAARPDVIMASFGDMLRVPGSCDDLLSVKARGGDVRMVYSPLDAVALAEKHPDKQVVFFAVGFETTAPANAMAVRVAQRKRLLNFSILSSHVRVPPAMEAILSSPECRVQAFLAAGHVCAVMGWREYIPIAEKFKVPIVVTGFEPIDILQGIFMAAKALEEGRCAVENQYARAVVEEGNLSAQALLTKIFDIGDKKWRGIGMIPQSGFDLKSEFAQYDAEKVFDVQYISVSESALCIAGDVLRGLAKPFQCPAFGKECQPEHPLGAPMVSSEGACAAYFHYRK
jgi:hydrogenase expression/formation protein HypD